MGGTRRSARQLTRCVDEGQGTMVVEGGRRPALWSEGMAEARGGAALERPCRQLAVRVSRVERPLPVPPLPPPAPREDLDGERSRPAARCAVPGVAREHAAEDLARSLGPDGLEALEGDRAPRPGPLQGARQAELRRRARRARGGRGHERRAARRARARRSPGALPPLLRSLAPALPPRP